MLTALIRNGANSNSGSKHEVQEIVASRFLAEITTTGETGVVKSWCCDLSDDVKEGY
jgi:hypothetical protein